MIVLKRPTEFLQPRSGYLALYLARDLAMCSYRDLLGEFSGRLRTEIMLWAAASRRSTSLYTCYYAHHRKLDWTSAQYLSKIWSNAPSPHGRGDAVGESTTGRRAYSCPYGISGKWERSCQGRSQIGGRVTAPGSF